LAQITPEVPRTPIIRSLSPALSSLGPTAFTAPPGKHAVSPEPEPQPEAPRPRRPRRVGVWIALGVVVATAAGIAAATHSPAPKAEVVSGRAALKMTKAGTPERWWQGTVPVTVDQSLTQIWPDATLGVEQAFDGWQGSGAKLPKATFDARKSDTLVLSPDGENRIYYAPITVPGHENDLALTLQYSNPNSGEILEADIVVNSKHPFAVLQADDDDAKGAEDATSGKQTSAKVKGCDAKYDVASVVTHEIGHFWGLGEDMTDTNATMYYSTPLCNVVKRHLKTDDVKAISSLYAVDIPAEDSASSSAAHCTVTAPGARAGNTGAFAVIALGAAVCAMARRRARPASS
jgi:hypothetical protein